MSDHPTDPYDAERGPPPLTSPEHLPNDRHALDSAMSECGYVREPRYREVDMVNVIARQHLAMRLKLGNQDNRAPSAAVFREAMALHGCRQVDRYNARAIGRVLADTWGTLNDCRTEIEGHAEELAELEHLRGINPPCDEPTEEAAPPAPVFDVPEGLEVRPLHPRSPAARRGETWVAIRHKDIGEVVVCDDLSAVPRALDVLRVASWVGLAGDDDACAAAFAARATALALDDVALP